ncbi:MAG: alpha/beta hydrolase [Candidatus Hydrogenedentes bacterium]|nr:alpha/beta hydrolase [Candidatus Hydrogenedentota bacterium]
MAAIAAGKVKLITPRVDLPDGVLEEKNLEYGKVGDKSLELDLYYPANLSKAVPALIFIHGGGWKGGNRSDYRYYTVRYAKRGYVVATISYRFAPENLFPAAVEDAKCAARWLRANAGKYHVDPQKIGVLGGSAGGHLSMMVGYSSEVPELDGPGGNAGVSSRVQAVVNLYGPCDLTTPFAQKADVVQGFIGKTYEEAPDLYAKASPITYLSKDDPPTLILHGTIDDVVPIEQSDTLAMKLKELGVSCTYEKFEGWPHTMDLAEAVNERCRYFIDEFLDKNLPLPK